MEDTIPIPQAEGHVIMLANSRGSNSDTSGTGYMDGAQVVISELRDLNQGSGPHQGYVTQTLPNGDEIVASFRGDIITTLTQEGQPNTSFKGSWEMVSGRGRYEGIKGSGNYTGYFISEKDSIVDWKGYYYIK